MIMSIFLRILAIFILSGVCAARAEEPPRWIVYYGSEEPVDSFLDYDIIAFDREHHPPLRQLQNRGKILLGYVSFGEAETYRQDFEAIKELGVLLEENPDWPGHYIVDIRNPIWTKYIIETAIPYILHQGFNGIIVDTIDSIEYLEEREPEKYKGMTEGAVSMVKAVRQHYPELKIMINRGFKTLPEIADDIDYVLAESILVKHLPGDKSYELFPQDVYDWYADSLRALKDKAPHLTVVSVDYWDMNDKEGVRHIYETQRANGYLPYVTTIDLMAVHPEQP